MKSPLIELTPDTVLTFNLPPAGEKDSTCHLQLRNTQSDKVLFKIKTTAPKEYCVRPNSGLIEAGAQIEVAVVLQGPLPRPIQKKDKFLVQTALCDSDISSSDAAEKWKTVAKEDTFEVKLKCNWNFCDSAAAAAAPTVASPAVAPASEAAAAASTQGPQGTPRRRQPDSAAAAAAPSSSSAAATLPSSSSSRGLSTPVKAAAKDSGSRTGVTSAAGGASSTAVVAKGDQGVPHVVLLAIVFLLGIVFGRFVI